jgi:hypothetical protein
MLGVTPVNKTVLTCFNSAVSSTIPCWQWAEGYENNRPVNKKGFATVFLK